jgi:hypothetical protein
MPTIRLARAHEYDEIARVWMESWVSTGLEDGSKYLLANLRARVPREIENGWSLYVADEGTRIAAMLALHLPDAISTSSLSRRNIRVTASAASCSISRESTFRKKSGCAASARTTRLGAGMSARVLCSKRKRSSPRQDLR